MTKTIHVPREAIDPRIDRFLVSAVPGLSLERARALLSEGRVRIRGKACKSGRKLWGGEEIELDLPTPAAPVSTASGPILRVLHDADDLLIIDKPAGLVVEPEGTAPSIVGLAAAQLGPFDVNGKAEPGVAHRLDRETSGCLALARTDAALAALKAAFEAKQVEKRYVAIVLGSPPDSARLEAPYGRNPLDPRRFTTQVESARRASLSYVVRQRFADAALLEVRLETGRTHQIRVQLSEAGFPVLADSTYGTEASRNHPAAKRVGRQALHAESLKLPGASVTSPLPGDFAAALAILSGKA